MKYFIHLPKTGGSALRLVFEDHVTKVYSEYPKQPSPLMWGHFPWGLHYLYRDTEPAYMTVLRDPRFRVPSHYWHHRRAGHPVASGTIEEYVTGEAVHAGFRGNAIQSPYQDPRNWMTRWLSGAGSVASVETALLRLKDFAVVGLTSDLDGAARGIAEVLGVPVPRVVEVGRAVYPPTDAALSSLVEAHNELDCELYQRVVDLTST